MVIKRGPFSPGMYCATFGIPHSRASEFYLYPQLMIRDDTAYMREDFARWWMQHPSKPNRTTDVTFNSEETIFMFTDADVALQFKLTWL